MPYPHSLPIAFITNLLLMIKEFIRRGGLLIEKRLVKATLLFTLAYTWILTMTD
jgi:hypothetical protein